MPSTLSFFYAAQDPRPRNGAAHCQQRPSYLNEADLETTSPTHTGLASWMFIDPAKFTTKLIVIRDTGQCYNTTVHSIKLASDAMAFVLSGYQLFNFAFDKHSGETLRTLQRYRRGTELSFFFITLLK